MFKNLGLLLILACYLSLLIEARPGQGGNGKGNGGRGGNGGKGNNGRGNKLNSTQLFSQLNATIFNVSAALISSPGPNTSYVWDLLPFEYRFALLNQSQILNNLNWNITQNLIQNNASLNWTYLPPNIQLILFSQQLTNSFVNLTFSEWNWVSSSNSYANLTLYSLLSSNGLSLLPNVTSLLSTLPFAASINLTALNQLSLSSNSNLFSNSESDEQSSQYCFCWLSKFGKLLFDGSVYSSFSYFQIPITALSNARVLRSTYGYSC